MTSENSEKVYDGFAYKGLLRLQNGSLGHAMVPLDLVTHEVAGESVYFKPSATLRRLHVGGMYKVERPAPGSWMFASATRLGLWPDRSQVEAWCAASAAAEAAHRSEKAAERINKANRDLTTTMGPLCEQYQKLTSRADRVAFEMYVLNTLRGW